MASKKPSLEQGLLSTSSSSPANETDEGFSHKLAAKDREIEELIDQIDALEKQVKELSVKYESANSALSAKLGKSKEDSLGGIPDVGWGLLWQEYFRRTGQFKFVSPDGLRSKNDGNGSKWFLHSLPTIEGDERQVEIAVRVAQELGYDPNDPPKEEYMLLCCFPDAGKYDQADVEIEAVSRKRLAAQRQLIGAKKELAAAADPERARMCQMRVDSLESEISEYEDRFMQCKAVIEHAVQRYYLVSMAAFASMDEYGIPVACSQATVVPQKRHMHLPDYEEREPVVAPQHG